MIIRILKPSLPWRKLRPEEQRRAKVAAALLAARTYTRYARSYPRRVDGLEQLPKVDLLEFLCHTERYTVAKAKPPKERFFYPLGEAPRTAVVGRKIEESRRVKAFSSLQSQALASYAPQVLAAPLDRLRALVASEEPPLPLRNAVVAFTGILEGPLTPTDSAAIWRRLQVPVFEQFLGLDGELLAWECEIHQGLHVRETAAHFECNPHDNRLLVSFLANPRLPLLRLETGLTGHLVSDACPCGDPSPRLMELRRRSVRPIRSEVAMAAAAVS